MKTPIAVMSFNRPGYLEQVLNSLRSQLPDTLAGREIHLFQDGAVNAYSDLRYAEDADIASSIETFRRVFPDGTVHHSVANIGICENFYRAENYFFSERDFSCAYFFEDDMIVSPCYLQMMDILKAFADRSPRVAYFAAYGDYYSSAEEQVERRREIILLDHHWAFGLQRDAWRRIREQTAEFHRLTLGIDYARRPHKAIYALYDRFKAVPAGTSQDAAKAFACDRLGLLRLRTFATFARYIGSKGAHMTPEKFEKLGFSRAVMLDQPILDLAFPDNARIDQLLAQQRAEFERIYREDLPRMVAGRAATWPPMRLCEREDIGNAYRLLLARPPENEAVFQAHVGRTRVFALVRGIVSSEEYAAIEEAMQDPKKLAALPPRPLSPVRLAEPDEVIATYRLLLHRDPESEQIIANSAGKRRVADVVRSILSSREYGVLSSQQGD